MKIEQPTQRMATSASMAIACAAVWMIGSGMSTAQGLIPRQAVPRRAVLPERLPKPVQVEPAGGPLQTDAQGRQFLVGKLVWRDLEGGFWQLNGFVLGNPPQLQGFKAGETVRVFGRAAPPNQASTTQAGPVFHVTSVQRLIPDQPAEPPKLTDEQVAQVKKLVADLGSSGFQTRQAAEEALRKIGPGALPYVREQVKSPDAEVAERAGRIVEHLESLLPPPPGKVEIKLSVDRKQYKPGETMQLTVVFTNQGDNPVRLPCSGLSFPWVSGEGFQLIGPDGKAVAMVQGQVRVMRRVLVRPLVLAAGASLTQTVVLSVAKDVPRAGMLRLPPGRIQPRTDLDQPQKGEVEGAATDVIRPPANGQTDEPPAKPEPLRAEVQMVPAVPPASRPADAPLAVLLWAQSGRYFPLAAAGKYTLTLQLTAEAAPQQPMPGDNPVMDKLRNVQGVMQVDGNPQEGVRPFVGVVTSNAAAFELVADK